ncbi:MAG: antitoxin [Deltaproteobacteria bacterium]|jgi:predicted DNA binding CopG/RHH family protein|nr:antitoxin [Deltaproteobacteria bacterium]MBT4268487.1 antitoxin [Deltaproteobacteria bacterium]MBT4644003.1 antitoxin [Deltaproteobacteria bacterium]MBT6500788.1 antitoxin [Deltaproteobacteria bacterium]MBT6614611.1 antitoxin [Deltaproteobacteria bacterium]
MIKKRNYNHPKMFEPLDEEEAQIMAEADQYIKVSEKESERINVKFKTATRNTLKKTERTNIRISETDLEGLKLIAAQEGIGYQTLISGILHKVASGQLQI